MKGQLNNYRYDLIVEMTAEERIAHDLLKILGVSV